MKKFIVPALAVLAAVSCAQNKKAEDNTTAAVVAVKKINVQAAEKFTVPQDQTYSTTVLANITNNIASQSAGRIEKICAEVGDFVKAGQILAEMDRVQLDQSQLRLKNQEDELNRIKALYAEGGVSQSDYESAVLAYNVAKAANDNLEENTILRSPIDGVVSARNYDASDMYIMGAPVFTVQQIVPVKLLVAVSETDYTKVSRGDRVSITADALPGKTFTGSVVRLYPTIDASSHTFNVEVQVPNTGRLLRPGMFARATVNFGNNVSIVVPDIAVLKQQGSGTRMVYVEENGVAVTRIVTLGRHFDSKYEILSGLEEGEKVIVKGQASLKAGEKVEVEQ